MLKYELTPIRPEPFTDLTGITLQNLAKYTLTFCYVQVEEIAVQDCLNTACYNRDQVEEAFKIESVDPVEDVERTIGAQSEQVVAGDGLGLARLANHEELRQNGH